MLLHSSRACLGQMFLSVRPVRSVGCLCWAHYIVLVVSGVFVLHLLMVIISAGVHTDSLGHLEDTWGTQEITVRYEK